jgi:hypothetical protein
MFGPSVTYANPEVRGLLRVWKQKLARDYAAFERGRALAGDLRDALVDLVKRSSRAGRERALAKIQRACGPGVTLELAYLDDKHPHAIFSILRPRDAITIEMPDETRDAERGSLMQDCVAVNYFVAGYIPGPPEHFGVAEGLWTLEVPDHALGRAVERSRFLHPGAIIREGHLNLLALPSSVMNQLALGEPDQRGELVKAGPGAFVAHMRAAPDVSLGDAYAVHVRVRTWLADDMLHENQIPLREKGEPGDQLGDGWLRPVPYRRIRKTSDGLTVIGWRPREGR